jgi:hypothetical protein
VKYSTSCRLEERSEALYKQELFSCRDVTEIICNSLGLTGVRLQVYQMCAEVVILNVTVGLDRQLGVI